LKKLAEYVNSSPMLATALNTVIGYEKAAKVAKTAISEDISLKEAAVKLGFLSAEEFDAKVNAEAMTKPSA
jgi:fumarate hydratase class II